MKEPGSTFRDGRFVCLSRRNCLVAILLREYIPRERDYSDSGRIDRLCDEHKRVFVVVHTFVFCHERRSVQCEFVTG